jgi:hypothetical protein
MARCHSFFDFCFKATTMILLILFFPAWINQVIVTEGKAVGRPGYGF